LTKVQLKDKELLSKIDAEIAKVIAQLKKDPNNSIAKELKEKLEELKAFVESRVEEREQEITNAATSNLTQEQLAER
jgi:transposase